LSLMRNHGNGIGNLFYKREVVLAKLSVIVKQFVRKISLERNLPEAIADEAGGKIFTFGSYRLGCNLTGNFIGFL